MTMLEELSAFPLFEDIPSDQIDWIARQGELISLDAHEVLFSQGDSADHMFIILNGTLCVEAVRGGQRIEIMHEKGAATGLLPFSRMTEYGGTGTALAPLRLLRIHRDRLPQFVEVAPRLTERLVTLMTDRVRNLSDRRQQQEKMLALGKLAAGLAHELNNPASAIQRDSHSLAERTTQMDAILESLCGHPQLPEYLIRVDSMRDRIREAHPSLTTRERARREDEIAEWLDLRGTKRSFELAETFVDGNLTLADLETLVDEVPAELQVRLLSWIEQRMAIDQAVHNIREAAERISALVNAVKSYAYMDRSPDRQETDIHAGIDSTLTMLGHKLKSKDVTVERDYAPDLPLVSAVGGELNQVWTNLIDNAIDAVPEGGRLRISTRTANGRAIVELEDNGAGIPDDLKSRIFDPFFTTKEVGEGTGLGLDIVQRIVRQHGGTIDVESSPGRTSFVIGLNVEA